MTELSIVPECYVDTKVAEILGHAKKYNHQHGCGNVANELNNRLKNYVAVGIIDEDKYKGPAPKFFSNFEIINQSSDLVLKRHKERKQYLILICPEIGKWLSNNSAHVNINPVDYSLPDKLKGFIKITKTQNIDNNMGFKRFIKNLVNKEAPGIVTLKNWIELFKLNQPDSLKNDAD